MADIKKYWFEICIGCIVVGLCPLLWVEANHLWERPHFQFFPIAWLAVAYFTTKQAGLGWTSNRLRAGLGLVAIVLGCASLVLSALRGSPWVAHLSLIFWITAWGLLHVERIPAPRWLSWTLLLWITLPLPLGYDTQLVQELQVLSSASAGDLLDLIGTPHLRLGNLIEIRPKRLFVDEACSGVDSLYSLTAVTLLMLVAQRRPFVVGFFTLLLVPAWTWLGNVLRLTLIAWLLDQWQVDLSGGWQHTALGLALFGTMAYFVYLSIHAVALLFVRFSSGALPRENRELHLAYNSIVCWPGKAPQIVNEEDGYFDAPRAASKKEVVVPRPTAEVTEWKVIGGLLKWGVPAIAVAGLLLGGWSVWKATRPEAPVATLRLPHFDESVTDQVILADAMPADLGPSVRTGFGKEHRSLDSFFGEYSGIWQYSLKELNCLVSLDFPFRGFHGLWVCYENSGNRVLGTPQIESMQVEGVQQPWPYEIVELEDPIGGRSYLWFTLFERSGRPIEMQPMQNSMANRLVNRMFDPDGTKWIDDSPVTYQYQLFVPSGNVLTAEEKQQCLEMFRAGLPHAVKAVQLLNQQQESFDAKR